MVLMVRQAGTPAATAVTPLSPDFMNVYYQIRSSQLDRSIKGLKEHFRKSSSSSGVPYSPAIPNKRKDTPTKKPIKRPGESPPRKAAGPGLFLATLQLAASALQSSSSVTPNCRNKAQKASVYPPSKDPIERGSSFCSAESGGYVNVFGVGRGSQKWRGRVSGVPGQSYLPGSFPSLVVLSGDQACCCRQDHGMGRGEAAAFTFQKARVA